MPRYFCTLFDKSYLFKGISLINSLYNNCDDFYLYTLCMDNVVYDILTKLNFKNIKLISLNEFEDKELKKIKYTRRWGEYCWTCTPSLLLYILKTTNNIDNLAYIDSDIYFFNNPDPIYKEFNGNNVLITEHNFSEEYESEIKYGKYNVQFLIFRNNVHNIDLLNKWRLQTINFCYSRTFSFKKKGGDQIYLNNWPDLYKKVHVLKNMKVCLAPWNVNKYNLYRMNGTIYVEDTPLIFYHFSTFKIYGLNNFKLSDKAYKLTNEAIKYIYFPYIKEINNTIRLISKIYSHLELSYKNDSIMTAILDSIKKIKYDLIRFGLKIIRLI